MRLFSLISSDFVNLTINTLRLSGYFLSIAQHAIGQSSINQGKIVQIIITLPPLAEQDRIVAKVDELMALCDKLEQQQTDSNAAHQALVETLLSTLTAAADLGEFAGPGSASPTILPSFLKPNTASTELKQTLLQLAVMGRLVPQDPNDEPASVLLAKIAKKKPG